MEQNGKMEQILSVLEGLKIDEMTDKHYLLGLKLIVEDLVNDIGKGEDSKLLAYAKNRLEGTATHMGDKYFEKQSDLYMMMTAYEAVITHLNTENKTFTKFVLNENINR